MASFSSWLIFCVLIISVCNAADKCLAFSGGGIRAAMGAYYTMRRLEKDDKLYQIKCVSLISGGSWGFIMWLYEEKPGAVTTNILKWIYENDMKDWGAKGPIEVRGDSWFEKWSAEIKTYIIGMTSLKDKTLPRFENELREQLEKRGLQDAVVYFVVESVDPQITKVGKLKLVNRLHPLKVYKIPFKMRFNIGPLKVGSGLARFKDYCWFSSSPTGDKFRCSKEETAVSIDKARIKQKKKSRPIQLLDVLNYCSSAWATALGQVNKHKHTTKEFRIYTGPITGGKYTSFRLIDAGGTFNDPLIPYMFYKDYHKDKVEIWNFDFSHYGASDELGNIKEIKKLGDAMKQIGKPIDDFTKFLDGETEGTERIYNLEVNDRKIVHCPLYGKYSKEKFLFYFPTMRGTKFWGVKGWNMMRVMFFEREWNGNLKNILKTF